MYRMSSLNLARDNPPSNDNVVPFKRGKKNSGSPWGNRGGSNPPPKSPKPPSDPYINLPPATKWLAGLMLAGFIIPLLLPNHYRLWIDLTFGLVPAALVDSFRPLNLFGPVTYMFLHNGWGHVIINTVMLVAMGSGFERWQGSRRTVILFIASGLIGAAAHLAFYPHSPAPVVGASAAVSGIFAGVVMMLYQGGHFSANPNTLRIFVVIWIIITVIFGVMGGPGHGSIAWIAHLGGFIGGFAIFQLMNRTKK